MQVDISSYQLQTGQFDTDSAADNVDIKSNQFYDQRQQDRRILDFFPQQAVAPENESFIKKNMNLLNNNSSKYFRKTEKGDQFS